MSIKNSNDTIGNRTRDLPACSAVPEPTSPPRVWAWWLYKNYIGFRNIMGNMIMANGFTALAEGFDVYVLSTSATNGNVSHLGRTTLVGWKAGVWIQNHTVVYDEGLCDLGGLTLAEGLPWFIGMRPVPPSCNCTLAFGLQRREITENLSGEPKVLGTFRSVGLVTYLQAACTGLLISSRFQLRPQGLWSELDRHKCLSTLPN
jgi:hypothetical protein